MFPIAFGDCFGWLHPGERACGVVLCGPIGFEKQIFHRSIRLLADRLSEAGYPTLRFDYPGTGDAAGVAGTANEQEAWLDAIGAAAAWLRAHAGVTRLVLCGIELGALLAGEVAARIGGVDRLILAAPVTSGRTFARTFQLAARLSADRLSQPGAGPPHREAGWAGGQGTDRHPCRSLTNQGETSGRQALASPAQARAVQTRAAETTEAYGLALHETTLRALARLDLTRLATVPAREILLLDATGLDSVEALGTAFRDGGAGVTRLDMPDYLHWARQAHESELPTPSFNRILDWLRSTDISAGFGGAPPCPAIGAASAPATLRGREWIEHLVVLDSPCGRTAAILCRPARQSLDSAEAGSCNAPAMLIVNTGANPRYGYGRFGVTLARALAEDGVMSLRLDLTGIGDSVPDNAATRPKLFSDRSTDIAAGLAFLAAQGAPASVGFGICSGAFQVFRAALSDRRLCGLVLVNQPAYRAPAGPSWLRRIFRLAALRHRPRGKSAPAVHDSLERLRLLPGVPKHLRLSACVTRVVRAVENTLLRPIGLHAALSFPRRSFERLAARGVPALVVTGDGDPAHLTLQAHFGSTLSGLRRISGHRVLVEPDFDHPVGHSGSQQRLLAATRAFLAQYKVDRSGLPIPVVRQESAPACEQAASLGT